MIEGESLDEGVSAFGFAFKSTAIDEYIKTGKVWLRSLRGVDAAHLVLADIDISHCKFTGAFNLDQLSIEGETTFRTAPARFRMRHLLPHRTPLERRTLVEEHYWRVSQDPKNLHWLPSGPLPAVEDAADPKPGPASLAATYRALRKAFEDVKNEPDAADFYYGEMEMRRHDTTRPWSERALLASYWAVSGYGLRASRALLWLAGAMTATVLVMMLWGIPANISMPTTTGRQVRAGQTITLVTDTPLPVNPTGPLVDRLTTDRFEQGLRAVINSVVFRSSGLDLTTAGTYAEMASRFTEPVLLGLAILAVRNRVKR
jgi:hypothetical protein